MGRDRGDRDHAHVLLGLIIVEGDGEVLYEGEHLVGALQAIEQVLGFALRAASPTRWPRVGRIASR